MHPYYTSIAGYRNGDRSHCSLRTNLPLQMLAVSATIHSTQEGQFKDGRKGACIIKGSCCSWAGDDDKQSVHYITTPFVLVARDMTHGSSYAFESKTGTNQFITRAFKISLSRVAAQRLADSFFSTPQCQVVL